MTTTHDPAVPVGKPITEDAEIATIRQQHPGALSGLTVTCVDGEVGQVADENGQLDDEHLAVTVDKGPFGLFSKTVRIELEAVDRIDLDEGEIHVARIGEWVKSAPTL